jgi:hypothetical protein
VTAAHEVARALHEKVFYPAHDARTESPAYAKVHHRLAVVEDRPCLICGVRSSTLGDPAQNRHGATAMETHHHIVEWALQNAIDLAKFNEHVWPALQDRHPGKYPEPFTQQSMLDFIDHSEDNLWVLCDVHHRHSLVGIHSITGPIWGAQNLVRDDFTYIP